ELFGAVACKDKVGVRIYKARKDGATACVEASDGRESSEVHLRGELAFRPDPGDAPCVGGEGAAFDDAECACRARDALGRKGDEAGSASEDKVGGGMPGVVWLIRLAHMFATRSTNALRRSVIMVVPPSRRLGIMQLDTLPGGSREMLGSASRGN